MAAVRRRMRGAYPVPEAGEIVYHHVVRQGVDEQAVVRSLRGRSRTAELLSFWSNHLGAIHRAAELAGLENTFGVRATGFSG